MPRVRSSSPNSGLPQCEIERGFAAKPSPLKKALRSKEPGNRQNKSGPERAAIQTQQTGQSALLLQDLAGSPETFQGLRNTAIYANHMNDGADLLLGNAVINGAAAMQLPFMHLAQRANH